MASGTTQGLIGVWGTSATDVFAVGGGGTILHLLTGSTPEPIPSLSWWGMFAMAALLLLFGAWRWTRSATDPNPA
jgi:hypothetical protein